MNFRAMGGAVLGALLLTSACSNESSDVASGSPTRRQPLTEGVPSRLAPLVKLKVGEECTQFADANACESGLCLRVAAGLPAKGFCSVKCSPAQANACPDGPGTPWACLQLFPSEHGWFCSPHRQHTSGVATLRSLPFPVPIGSVGAGGSGGSGGAGGTDGSGSGGGQP